MPKNVDVALIKNYESMINGEKPLPESPYLNWLGGGKLSQFMRKEKGIYTDVQSAYVLNLSMTTK